MFSKNLLRRNCDFYIIFQVTIRREIVGFENNISIVKLKKKNLFKDLLTGHGGFLMIRAFSEYFTRTSLLKIKIHYTMEGILS